MTGGWGAAGAVAAVAGGAIRSAEDPAAAAKELRAATGRAVQSATNVPRTTNPGPHGVPLGRGDLA